MLKKIKALKNIKIKTHRIEEKIKAQPYGAKMYKYWWIIPLAIFLYACYGYYDNSNRLDMIEEERAMVMRQIEEEKAEQKRLLEECEKLKQPEYIEQVAREELGYVKPGEIPYISREKKTH
ncbi:MAG: septum formation initiator family protein [Selenomonadales bacterium]|nr:septum formation initiator family protein [Selenomonadales bacterium]